MPLRIVYAEDDEGVRTAIADVLRLAGVMVITCDTGAEAVRLCEGLQPDALLLDIGMPRVDGYEVARRVRESPRIRTMRVVAFTGYSLEESRKEAALAGIDVVLSKPASVATLIAALTPSGNSVEP